MADAKSDDPRTPAKTSGRRGKATRAATKRATETKERVPSRAATAANASVRSGAGDSVMAYAMGQMSLEQLANAKSGRGGRGDSFQAPMALESIDRGMEGEDDDLGDRPRQQRRVRRQANVAGAIQRLRQAKDTGVLSRAESDRAADSLLAETPEGAIPPRVEVKTPRQPAAEGIVRTHAWLTSAAGLLSLGFLNPIVVPGLQLRMLQNLCNLYGVRFSEEWGKNLIGTLVGTATANSLAVRAIPYVGVLAAPVTNAASTWAVGRVFILHFESGGTLLNFNPSSLKSYFAEYFNSAPPLVTSAG